MTSIVLTAPAKVNLFLKVLGKRTDGYHNLHTLFERISLADEIKLTRIPKGISLSSDKFITARAKDNIAFKAAEAILSHAKVQGGVRIEISKRIPIAAGLGGGSSDAAAVLEGINKLYCLDIPNCVLRRIGSKLGADVPFFLLHTPYAIGRGIGDKLRAVDSRLKLWHLLIYPGFKVATKDVYKELDKNLTWVSGGDKMTFPKRWNDAEGLLWNDLEGVVAGKRPVIGKIIQCLASSLGKRAIVSGSGPSVFCLYKTRKGAIQAKERLFRSVSARVRKRWQAFIVETEA